MLAGLAVFSLILFLFLPEEPPREVAKFRGATMGTTYEVILAGETAGDARAGELKERVDRELEAVNAEMSTYIPDSQISRFNRAGVAEVTEIGPGFREVWGRSVEISEAMDGAFDPAVGPLIDLWGFGAGEAAAEEPSAAMIRELRERAGMEQLVLTEEGLAKRTAGVEINLSAIAKGYAVDRVQSLLMQEGYVNIYVEIGGEVACLGVNPNGVPWRIGIQLPDPDSPEELMRAVSLHNRAIATSGDYRNFRETKGGRRHHIIDPRTGRPAEHALASVSVLATDCMTADAVATGLYVMGMEEGMDWVEAREGIEALFIDRGAEGFTIRMTEGFSAALIDL